MTLHSTFLLRTALTVLATALSMTGYKVRMQHFPVGCIGEFSWNANKAEKLTRGISRGTLESVA